MKNKIFTFDGKAFEIYNTTENAYHAIELKQTGERKSPNPKTLSTWKPRHFQLGLDTKQIILK